MNSYTMDFMSKSLLNEHGEPIKTKQTHPYNYDPIVLYKNGKTATGSVYSDRLFQQDYEKHDEICQKVFGNRGQYWDKREPKQIEKFLSEYFGKKITLTRITEYCNQSTGYPCWRFDYKDNETNPTN